MTDRLSGTPMGDALLELAARMEAEELPPVTLHVIGGFALMLRGVRPLSGVTDIDYLGPELHGRTAALIEEIGAKHHMESGWINNDGMLFGDSLEDFELATGKLHFDQTVTLGKIRIQVLSEPDLLRMKLIAIDTALTEYRALGTFARTKDFSDIYALMKKGQQSPAAVCNACSEYLIMPKGTAALVSEIWSLGPENAAKKMDQRVEARTRALKQKNEGFEL